MQEFHHGTSICSCFEHRRSYSRACNKRKLDSARTARTEMKESWHDMSSDEEDLIEKLHNLLGDRWELISGRLPNRTAAEVEKYWTTKERKKFMQTKLFRPTCVRAHPRLKSGTAESSKGRKR